MQLADRSQKETRRHKSRKMKMKKSLTTILLLIVGALSLSAQVTVEATIDSIEMLIGQQVHVTVKATAPEQQTVVFQHLKPRQILTPGVEIVDVADLGSKPVDNGMAVSQRRYTLTSFDGKLYYLPPFTVKVGGKQYKSKSLALKVIEVEVDTTQVDKFFGPKDVQDNPFEWAEWAPLFWASVLMVVLFVAACYLYIRLKQGKPVVTPKLKMVRRLLPHQKAMKEIEQIKADRMVSSENQKEYYTKLTDTLRKYIEERYGFNAMEMTSTEIIDRLTHTGDAKAIDELTTLFRTADLVKFAKFSALINENDMNLVSAIDFINSTKLDTPPVEQVQRPKLTEEEKRTVKSRRTLVAVIAVSAAVCLGLLVYVVYETYQLLQ